MQIELDRKTIEIAGEQGPLVDAVAAALAANGAALGAPASGPPDILVVALPLLSVAGYDPAPLLQTARQASAAMARRGHGRVLFLVSALAGLPMRRHPEFSVAMATVVATVRTLAMEFGPHVLVNAVGVGMVGEPLLAGDAAMLSHSALPRSATLREVADTVLFFCDPLNSYTTGQILCVDGGWSAGYGRNF